jgi:hypothetical protein
MIDDSSSSLSSSGEQNDDSRHSGSKGTTAEDSNGTYTYSSNKKATKSIFSGFWSDGETTTEGAAAAGGGGKNDKNNNNNRVVDYEGFNLTIGDVIYEIGVGDVVVMRSADEQNEINEQDNDDNDDGEEKDSRDQRRQRRLERDSNSNSNTKPGAAALESSTPSDYAADAKSDKASDYYNADNNDNEVNATKDGVAVAGGGDATDTPGNDEMKKQSESSSTEKEPAAAALSNQQTTTTSTTATSMNMKDAKVGDGLMLARVERIWQEKGRGGRPGKVLFQARWFLKKEDVDSLPLEEITGPISSEEFANRITEHDLVLSNQSDDNHVTTICGLIQGKFETLCTQMYSK